MDARTSIVHQKMAKMWLDQNLIAWRRVFCRHVLTGGNVHGTLGNLCCTHHDNTTCTLRDQWKSRVPSTYLVRVTVDRSKRRITVNGLPHVFLCFFFYRMPLNRTAFSERVSGNKPKNSTHMGSRGDPGIVMFPSDFLKKANHFQNGYIRQSFKNPAPQKLVAGSSSISQRTSGAVLDLSKNHMPLLNLHRSVLKHVPFPKFVVEVCPPLWYPAFCN